MEGPFADFELPVTQAEENTSLPSTVFIYDFETVPDEERYPQPEYEAAVVREPIPDREDIDIEDLAKGSVAEIRAIIAEGLSDNQLKELAAAESGSSKPRKTVLSIIEDSRNGDVKEQERLETVNAELFSKWKKEGSVNPLKARICAFGWQVPGQDIQSMTATNDDEERVILEKFWELIGLTRKRVGFNNIGFDDLLVVVRSAVLGVGASRPLDRRKYGNREATDLFLSLFGGSWPKAADGSRMTMKDIAGLLGVRVEAEGVEGSQVYDSFVGGDMSAIARYVRSDIAVTSEMYEILCEFMTL